MHLLNTKNCALLQIVLLYFGLVVKPQPATPTQQETSVMSSLRLQTSLIM